MRRQEIRDRVLEILKQGPIERTSLFDHLGANIKYGRDGKLLPGGGKRRSMVTQVLSNIEQKNLTGRAIKKGGEQPEVFYFLRGQEADLVKKGVLGKSEGPADLADYLRDETRDSILAERRLMGSKVKKKK